jgi:hypothetical protein
VAGTRRRDEIIAEAMQEAVAIRAAATDEITTFLRRLDTERQEMLQAARDDAARIVADSRALAATDAARLRDATEQELTAKSDEILAQAVEASHEIIAQATAAAAAAATRAEAEAIAAAAKVAVPAAPPPEPMASPEASHTRPDPAPSARPDPVSSAPRGGVTEMPSVRWTAELSTTSEPAPTPSPASTNGKHHDHDHDHDAVPAAATTTTNGTKPHLPETELVIEPAPKLKRRFGIFGRPR